MERVALVTGASRGIGRAVAERLAREGWALCIHYYQQEEAAQALARQLGSAGCSVLVQQAEISRGEEVRSLVAKVEQELGPVSLLVNNAGIALQAQFQDTTEEQWQRCFSVHVDGAFHCIQAVLPGMLREKAGSIINISSIWGQRGASCEVAYAASKAALIGLTRSLAAELGPSHIRVNCVAPGVIATDMLSPLSAEIRTELAQQTPLGRLGTPADVAAVVAFLAREEASFLTGQVITTDGGLTV